MGNVDLSPQNTHSFMIIAPALRSPPRSLGYVFGANHLI